MNQNTKSTEPPKTLNLEKTIINTKSEISIEKFPTINITPNSAPDYVTIASFVLAILSFLVTIYVINKGSKEQNDRDRKNREVEIQSWISDSRQKWINDLRDSIAEYISIGMLLMDLWSKLNEQDKIVNVKPNYKENTNESLNQIHENQKHLNKQLIKILLLLNKSEITSNLLGKELVEFKDLIYIKDYENSSKKLTLIQEYASSILKVEWDKAKQFNNVNN